MRRIFAATLSAASLSVLLFSCTSSRHAGRSNYVPFTKELKQKLEKENIDLKEVQFYVDQKLILTRDLGDQKVEVHAGVVKMENGRFINEVIIPSFTPGVLAGATGDKLMVSFEKGNNDLAFGPGSGYTFNEFVLYGTEWRNGTAAVTFDSGKFRARCGTCSDVAMATLLVQKSELDKMERKSRILKGRTVSSN